MTALFLAEASNPLQSVVEFLVRGGLFMWPLLICSIVALTVIILRSMALRRKRSAYGSVPKETLLRLR